MKRNIVFLALGLTVTGATAQVVVGSPFAAAQGTTSDTREIIIACGGEGQVICSYDNGGDLIGKSTEGECPGQTAPECPPQIEPVPDEPYPPTHER